MIIRKSWNHCGKWRNFSFCHNDFKICLLQRRQKASICRKGLMYESTFGWSLTSFCLLSLSYIQTNLQQTTLKINKEKYGNAIQMKELLFNQDKNRVANWEIDHNEQFLLLPKRFQKIICCRSVGKLLHVWKVISLRSYIPWYSIHQSSRAKLDIF